MKTFTKACAGFTLATTTTFLAWCGGAYINLATFIPGLASFNEIWFRVGINALMRAIPAFEAFCYATGLFV